ncbi:selenocysteine-specific elongation factor [Uranotaenia lowii]|uniref:selenocysteine-specific elongation factor n=1 Tax=Uranotaenia lowii TaxID=190385 RepID=UPI0024784BD3|nr:selenocysteine-specific elongation factor [Uranotaenia lowii]
MLNINVGIVGHVDSGKTTLAKALSGVASTAAFDKNPQSQQRGITLDLGFSGLQVNLPDHLRSQLVTHDKLQYTFVDCPGHASLIRTIIGGAQIVDMIILVVDIAKGIQTQTAECLVIGELTCRKMIVTLNKIDALDQIKQPKFIEKAKKGLTMALAGTVFAGSPVVEVSALAGLHMDKLVDALQQHTSIPERYVEAPFLFAVDHCFSIKGHGTVCTGTVLQGQVTLNEDIEIPKIRQVKKVKSIQMFKQSQQVAKQGDRVGLCITQFDPKLLERGLLSKPGIVKDVHAVIMRLYPIKYFKSMIRSGSKYHVTCGYETTMARILLFKSTLESFDINSPYEYAEELDPNSKDEHNVASYVLLEFEKPIQAVPSSLVIGSKLDTDIHSNMCRIAFHGHLDYGVTDKNYRTSFLPSMKVFKEKHKTGSIQRVVNESELIATSLFKKDGNNRQAFIGLDVRLSTGERGIIADTFGTTSKVKLRFQEPLSKETLEQLKQKVSAVQVEVKFKKFIFSTKAGNKVVQ